MVRKIIIVMKNNNNNENNTRWVEEEGTRMKTNNSFTLMGVVLPQC